MEGRFFLPLILYDSSVESAKSREILIWLYVPLSLFLQMLGTFESVTCLKQSSDIQRIRQDRWSKRYILDQTLN